MTFGVKHFDPVMGIDVHMVIVPPCPSPVPLPHPYVGMIMDPMDYLPFVGATVQINGLPRGQAGSAGIPVAPHLPLGAPSGPPPSGESEMFMGSMTVAFDGDAQSAFGHLVLSCQSIGMPGPARAKGSPPKSLVLPFTTALPIPAGPPVMIGGPPTISSMALGGRAVFAGLGKLGKMIRKAQRGPGRVGNAMRALARRANAAGDALAKALKLGEKGRNRVKRAVCTVTGHPVDVATGKVFTDRVDLALPGPIPFRFERVWYSTSTYVGPLGHGWHHSYDTALHVRDDVVLYRADDGRLIAFMPIAVDQEHYVASEKLTLRRDRAGYALHTGERQILRFAPVGRANGEHALQSMRDLVGHSIALMYDSRGRLQEVRDSSGRSLQLEYDAADRLVALSAPHPDAPDPQSRVVLLRYRYDVRGNLSEVVDALDQRASYQYRGQLLCREIDRNGLSFYFEYDAEDETAKCVRTWGDKGIYDHRLTYDAEHDITTVTNSLGHKTQYQHEAGLVVRTVDAHGAVTIAEYDDDDHLLQEIDALGRATHYRYDERGNLLHVLRPDQTQLKLRYDERDALVEATDALGGRYQLEYDQHVRLLRRTDPQEHSARYEYAGAELSALLDPNGNATALYYDAQGNLVQLRTPDAGTQTFAYDRLGRVVAQTDAAGNVQRRVYDLLGRVTELHEPDGNLRKLDYDPAGNVTHLRDAQHDVRFEYQGMGRLYARSEAATRVRFEYDTEEQLTGIVNEHGHVYRFELSATGEVLHEHGFDGIRRTYVRDLLGRVSEVQRASGLVSRYAYDVANRVVGVTHSDGSAEHYKYRADGALVSAKNNATELHLLRDALGRIVREQQGDHWVDSKYDARGLRVELSSSLGAKQRIARNAMGDVVGLTHERRGHAGAFEVQIARDLLGLEVERSLPGGVRSRWLRDKLGRPLRHELSAAAGTVLRVRQYGWDIADRLRELDDSEFGVRRFGHDALGNLAFAVYRDGSRELRMPDAVGNLFRSEDRRDRKYGPAGQLLEAQDERGRIVRYRYDAEGNLLSKRRERGESWLYRWGADGMLQAVVRPDGSEVSFVYDAVGRRVSKTYRGQTTHWVWDGNVPLHEWVQGELDLREQPAVNALWSADAEVRQREAALSEHLSRGPPERGSEDAPITWLFEPESFAPLAKLIGEQHTAIITDHLGTPVAMLDEAGHRVWSADLGTWGGVRRIRGEPQACPFRWPGQYEDAETGLYYNRFRYYDPEAGQYISQDPIGLRGGFAFYGYPVDPLCSIDPFGLEPCGPKIHPGKQGKHVPGHNNFQPGKSELTHPNPQALLDAHHGTGVPHGPTKEVVDFQEPIGIFVTQDGGRQTTTRGTIHYDGQRTHAHIVPAKPKEDL